jgi:hypothetical protein
MLENRPVRLDALRPVSLTRRVIMPSTTGMAKLSSEDDEFLLMPANEETQSVTAFVRPPKAKSSSGRPLFTRFMTPFGAVTAPVTSAYSPESKWFRRISSIRLLAPSAVEARFANPPTSADNTPSIAVFVFAVLSPTAVAMRERASLGNSFII